MGKGTDQELLDYLKDNPGKTIYELSKELEWSIGKVQKAIKRLGDKLTFEQDIVGGRLRKKYQIMNSF
jgi:predicted transcriptional regulator